MAARANELVTFGREFLRNTSLTPRLDAEVLLAYSCGLSKEQVYSREFSEQDLVSYHKLLNLRKAGKPLAYITGTKEFFGYEFLVSPSVLIPRPESEWLVTSAIDELRTKPKPQTVVDVGTGSGCLLIALAIEMPGHNYTGIDISADALKVARTNGSRLGAEVEWLESDLLDKFEGPVDLLISNPPYLSVEDYAGELTSEPRIALIDEGKNIYERLLATKKFNTGFFEMKPEQISGFKDAAASNGYQTRTEIIFGTGFAKAWR